MRFHKIANVNKALDFICSKGVKLVSIGAEGENPAPLNNPPDVICPSVLPVIPLFINKPWRIHFSLTVQPQVAEILTFGAIFKAYKNKLSSRE